MDPGADEGSHQEGSAAGKEWEIMEYRFEDGSDEGIGIDLFPYRKNKCLYRVVKGYMSWPMAYFRDDEEAETAERLLDKLAKATIK